MTDSVAFPRMDGFAAGPVTNEGNLGVAMESITPMTTKNVDRPKSQVSILQTKMTQNMKMDRQTAKDSIVSQLLNGQKWQNYKPNGSSKR